MELLWSMMLQTLTLLKVFNVGCLKSNSIVVLSVESWWEIRTMMNQRRLWALAKREILLILIISNWLKQVQKMTSMSKVSSSRSLSQCLEPKLNSNKQKKEPKKVKITSDCRILWTNQIDEMPSQNWSYVDIFEYNTTVMMVSSLKALIFEDFPMFQLIFEVFWFHRKKNSRCLISL